MDRSIKGKNILVTGGAGFIGSHLADRLLELEANKVVVVDNMFLGNRRNLKHAIDKGAVLYTEDAEIASSLEYIIKDNGIEVVFNCATKALNYSFFNPSNAYMTNVNVINNLLELQRKESFETLCHFSTSEVYGTAVYEPMDEMHPFHPTTTYAAGKAAADIMLNSYVNMFHLDSFIVRPFNNYGPRQNYSGNLAGVIPVTIYRILNGIDPEIHGTGEQKRDFIYVTDTVDAITELFKIMEPGDSVNVSSNGMISIREVIEGIAKQMGYGGQIIDKGRRNADVDSHNASNEKLKKLIRFDPISFDEGLRQTIEWYIKEIGGVNK
jgi:UDP-glucose 4-epimerase